MSDEPAGEYTVQRGMQSPAGMVSGRLLLDINLSDAHVGKPISFAPDLFVGVTDDLQLGILHEGPLGWQARPGLGICLTGKSDGCPHVYDNVGFDLMYRLLSERVDLSAHGSVFVDSFDPGTVGLALGFAGKAHIDDKISLVFDPKIVIALNHRDNNDDALYIPVELERQVGARTMLKLLTGLSGGLQHFGDTYQIPLGLGVVQNLNKHIDLGLRFSFDNLLGKELPMVGRADARSLALLLNFRS